MKKIIFINLFILLLFSCNFFGKVTKTKYGSAIDIKAEKIDTEKPTDIVNIVLRIKFSKDTKSIEIVEVIDKQEKDIILNIKEKDVGDFKKAFDKESTLEERTFKAKIIATDKEESIKVYKKPNILDKEMFSFDVPINKTKKVMYGFEPSQVSNINDLK